MAINDNKESFAWEITDEDIAMALQENCSPNGQAEINEVREFLDPTRVENAVLQGDSIEDQSDLAQEDILSQIREQ